MSEKETSKFISLILRHKPEVVGITLDEHGWADVKELLDGMNHAGTAIDMQLLQKIVADDEKQRYSFNEDKTLIRANQGHSIPVDVELEKKEPPEILYHGTGEKYVDSIMNQGLVPKSRLYVHLSKDYDTAVKVGSRHGKPVVFQIRAGEMAQAGTEFYLSVNGVWLTKHVPVEYLEIIGRE
ncbi:putative RNA 2'-phosphotransferase [Butyrivibrio sp. INlla18]|uniref:RNA 2'-phosphotransferase n=1 Tax=Butyrivibrio sp. INlla18 TaxID=1520806 RepID=UPI00088416DD|nr:RNA 2'-phosphotransferase [Butyrivibrio sp. INlla18]SDA39077.1 putative RNA 2'-phosphotransferase [Butyrivibrio sp. INlla18]